MRHAALAVLVVVLAILLVVAASAQKSFSATYDSERQVKLEGIVTRIDWVNPSAYLLIDVKDAGGTITNWAVEFGNPLELDRDGWKRNSLHIGDVVNVEGNPARGESRQAFAKSVVLKSTGKRLFVAPARRATAPAAPAPRWPYGRVRLGPPSGKKGYWGTASVKALAENTGVKIPMNDDGLLLNLTDADRVAPFQPWAKALYLRRQRMLLKDDPLARCLPPGGPRQCHIANGFQFIEQRVLGRILGLLGGGDNERFWRPSGGLPHTEALHLTERFSRPDLNTLKYEVTVDAPRTYTRTWTGGWIVQWVPDKEIEEYFCEENAESTLIR